MGIRLAGIGIESPDRLVTDLEENLRALLRDMVCGHIETDARRVADELLPDTGEIEAEAPGELAVDPPEPDFVVKRKPKISASAEDEPADEGEDWGFLDDDAADYSAAV